MYVMYMVVSMHTCVIDVSLLSVCNSVTSDVILTCKKLLKIKDWCE